MSSNPLSERLRFAEFVLDRLPNGRCRARVALTWRDSEAFSGESEGLASQAGELRCAAEACVKALSQAVQGGTGFELLGVKAVRAFDATVIIVSLAAQGEGRTLTRKVGLTGVGGQVMGSVARCGDWPAQGPHRSLQNRTA